MFLSVFVMTPPSGSLETGSRLNAGNARDKCLPWLGNHFGCAAVDDTIGVNEVIQQMLPTAALLRKPFGMILMDFNFLGMGTTIANQIHRE